jgi:UTP--glucose-1-phosphate uridylyltransferase
MGAAIEVFEGARALRVPRTRFAPVKTTDDLLALRSDAYLLTDDAQVVLADGRSNAPFVALDSKHYKLLRDFEERFPSGPPSLLECNRFEVEGDVHFGAGVVARGDVRLHGPQTIEDGTEL